MRENCLFDEFIQVCAPLFSKHFEKLLIVENNFKATVITLCFSWVYEAGEAFVSIVHCLILRKSIIIIGVFLVFGVFRHLIAFLFFLGFFLFWRFGNRLWKYDYPVRLVIKDMLQLLLLLFGLFFLQEVVELMTARRVDREIYYAHKDEPPHWLLPADWVRVCVAFHIAALSAEWTQHGHCVGDQEDWHCQEKFDLPVAACQDQSRQGYHRDWVL